MISRPRLVALALTAAAIVTQLRVGSADVLEQVLVKVNGDILTKTELEAKQIAALRGRITSTVDAEALKNDETLKKMIAEVTPKILVDTIDEMLLMQLGKEKGYHVTDQQFKDWLTQLRKDQNLDDENKFKAALAQEGMTMDDLRRNFEKQVTVYRVQQDEVGQKLQITEEEARQYYRAHPAEFTEEPNVTLREIMVETPTATQQGLAGVNVAQDDAARERATAIRGRILAGEDFGKVAGEVSAAASKSNGGLIGPINVSELSEPLQKLVKTMKPGQVTQPIRIGKGYQILKLETLKEASLQQFDDVRDLVAEKVHGERQRQEVRKFLTRVRGQAIIEWKNQELRKAYEQLIADMAKAG
jgi:peptidyl-prolyl cis-trans isomerase SurA